MWGRIRTAKVDVTNAVRHNTAGTEHLSRSFMSTSFTTAFLGDDVLVECWKVSITAARKIAKQRSTNRSSNAVLAMKQHELSTTNTGIHVHS